LASLQGLINLAQLDNPPEPFRNYFNMMGESVIRLDGFIKEVLDYSVNSRKELLLEPIDFEQLISETAEQLTLAENETAVLWKVEVTGQHNRFHSDRRRLQIIFNNLLSNALKFRDFKKDQLVIEILVGISTEGTQIRVEDNGIGIAAHHLDKIFNMFYRATEQNPGSGLGLYITREVVNKLAGTIQVHSEIRQYTRFIVWVPNKAEQ
jgi:signal transduction histidine kinase